MTAAIQCRNLRHSFPMGEEEFQVLKDVDLTIEQGEMVAIMGPSGSGKSTLMNLIGCLMTPKQGQLTLLGEETGGLAKERLAMLRSRYIGFVFQQFNLLSRTSALDNVKMPLMYNPDPTRDDDARARECLQLVGLGERMQHTPGQLSGGQQQRVAIARALVNRPQLILADEPTGALDTRTGEEIMGLFRQLNEQGITIVLVTHEPEVAAWASRTIVVRDGELEAAS
ncbi:ABC transporter ATP-binding protein [Ferrimonas sp.]|uniref:ABC transporter ATP-binding protein n=1 Tax=Ferrimonas sp. TaxID=2080861 RepID=UPI003A8FB9CF